MSVSGARARGMGDGASGVGVDANNASRGEGLEGRRERRRLGGEGGVLLGIGRQIKLAWPDFPYPVIDADPCVDWVDEDGYGPLTCNDNGEVTEIFGYTLIGKRNHD